MNNTQLYTRKGHDIFGGVLIFLLIAISSGAIFNLIRDGGAVAKFEGVEFSDYTRFSVLNYVRQLWCVLAIIYIAVNYSGTIVSLLRPKLIEIMVIGCILITSSMSPFYVSSLTTASQLIIVYIFFKSVSISRKSAFYISYVIISIKIIIASSIFLSVAVPSYGISLDSDLANRWQGVFDHKNGLAGFGVFSYCVFLYCIYSSVSLKNIFWLSMSALILIKAASTAGLLMIFICPVIIYFCIFSCKIGLKRLNAAIFAVTILLCLCFVYVVISGLMPDFLSKDGTISGRDRIWLFALQLFLDRLAVGYGVGGFGSSVSSSPESFLSSVGFIVMTAHNGIVDMLVSIGIVGSLLIFLSFVYIILLLPKSVESGMFFGWIIVALVYNYTEARFISFNIFYVGGLLLYHLLNLNSADPQER